MQLPTTKQAIYALIQNLLVDMAARHAYYPGAVLVDQFSAMIGHAGTNVDDCNNAVLTEQLRAKRLLVLSPYQTPEKLKGLGLFAGDGDQRCWCC